MAASPNMYFQPWSVLEKAPQTQAAINWPKVMIRTLQDTNNPLRWGGEASEMYIGTDIDANPIPAPTINRPTSKISRLSAIPITMAPAVNITLMVKENHLEFRSKISKFVEITMADYRRGVHVKKNSLKLVGKTSSGSIK